MKHLGSLKSTQEARVALGYASSNSSASLCSPNFPPASYLNECTLTYEPIVSYVVKWNTKSPEATIQLFKKNLKCRSLNQRKMKMTCKIAVKDGDHV